MRFAILALLLLTAPASAQQQPYAAPNQALWEAMAKALQDIPMGLPAHQAVQQILGQVQQNALAEAKKEKKPDAEPKP